MKLQCQADSSGNGFLTVSTAACAVALSVRLPASAPETCSRPTFLADMSLLSNAGLFVVVVVYFFGCFFPELPFQSAETSLLSNAGLFVVVVVVGFCLFFRSRRFNPRKLSLNDEYFRCWPYAPPPPPPPNKETKKSPPPQKKNTHKKQNSQHHLK